MTTPPRPPRPRTIKIEMIVADVREIAATDTPTEHDIVMTTALVSSFGDQVTVAWTAKAYAELRAALIAAPEPPASWRARGTH